MKRSVKLTPELAKLLRQQKKAFREKFGRDPGPGDPVFFDPNGDAPRPHDPDNLEELVLKLLADIEAPPEVVYAFKKTERLGLPGMMDNWPREFVDEWQAAIDEYHELQRHSRMESSEEPATETERFEKNDETRFLKLNANTDYMAGVLADCLRDCIRAIAAESPLDRRNRAVQHFVSLLRQFEHWDEPNLYDLFGLAIEELRPNHPDPFDDRKAVEGAYIVAAERGLRFLAELSANDPAAGGRASKRQIEFKAAIKSIDEAAERSRRRFDRDIEKARIGNESHAETSVRLAREMIEKTRRKPSKRAPSKGKKHLQK